MREYWRLLVALLGLLPIAAQAQVSISAAQTRTSCFAPCHMFFDAVASTHSTADTFHEALYRWDFDDGSAGTWSTGVNQGQSRNVAYGPTVAHVYHAAGTYTPTVYATDYAGNETSASLSTITVADPDTTFASTTTTCVGNSTPTAGVGGCPSGAAVLASSDFDAALSGRTDAGERVLFNRGDSFTSSTAHQVNNDGPVLIGAYGSGAKPAVTTGGGAHNLLTFSTCSGSASKGNVVVMDLDVTLNGGDAFSFNGEAHEYLFLRNDVSGAHKAFEVNAASGCVTGNVQSKIGIVDNTVTNCIGGSGGYGAYLGGKYQSVMGNVWDGFESCEHTLRVIFWEYAYVNHNELSGEAAAKQVIKLHALDPEATPPLGPSQYIVISDNVIAGDIGSWSVGIGPQTAGGGSENEFVEDLIMERNYCRPDPTGNGVSRCFVVWAFSITTRDNICDMQSADVNPPVCIEYDRRSSNPTGTLNDHRVYGNTFYTDRSASINAVLFSSQIEDSFMQGNLIYAPNDTGGTDFSDSGTGNTVSANFTASSNPFVESSFDAPEDFKIASPNASILGAGDTSTVFQQFDGTCRVGAPTIGAWEDEDPTASCITNTPGSRHEGVTPLGITYTLNYPTKDMEDRPLAGLRFCELSVRVNAGEPETYTYRPQDSPSLPLDAACGDEVTVTGTCTGMDGAVSQEYRRSERMPPCVSDTRPKPPQVSLRR